MSIESMVPSNHVILCRPLLLLPSIFPSIRVFSNESALCLRWSKYWSWVIVNNNSKTSDFPSAQKTCLDKAGMWFWEGSRPPLNITGVCIRVKPVWTMKGCSSANPGAASPGHRMKAMHQEGTLGPWLLAAATTEPEAALLGSEGGAQKAHEHLEHLGGVTQASGRRTLLERAWQPCVPRPPPRKKSCSFSVHLWAPVVCMPLSFWPLREPGGSYRCAGTSVHTGTRSRNDAFVRSFQSSCWTWRSSTANLKGSGGMWGSQRPLPSPAPMFPVASGTPYLEISPCRSWKLTTDGWALTTDETEEAMGGGCLPGGPSGGRRAGTGPIEGGWLQDRKHAPWDTAWP